MSDCDLVVVGGGPVGLGTAIEAALAGLRVTVVEARTGPVDKACGEGLMPAARVALERLGVLPAGRPFSGIRYVADGSSATARFRGGPGLGVRRTVLSAALGTRADDLGVRLVTARAGRPAVVDAGVEVAGVRARWLVGADGLHSPVRRAVGLDAPPAGPVRYGLRRHYRMAPWSDLVEVHWGASCEAYVTPIADDLVGVAVLGGQWAGARVFQQGLTEFPLLAARLAAAEPATALRGAGPLRRSATRRVAGPVLLVGDAAGYVDALTGEGIAVGLLAARELVGALLADDPQAYESAWRRSSRRYRMLTGALLWATTHPTVRGRIVPAAQRAPRLFGAAVDALA